MADTKPAANAGEPQQQQQQQQQPVGSEPQQQQQQPRGSFEPGRHVMEVVKAYRNTAADTMTGPADDPAYARVMYKKKYRLPPDVELSMTSDRAEEDGGKLLRDRSPMSRGGDSGKEDPDAPEKATPSNGYTLSR